MGSFCTTHIGWEIYARTPQRTHVPQTPEPKLHLKRCSRPHPSPYMHLGACAVQVHVALWAHALSVLAVPCQSRTQFIGVRDESSQRPARTL